MSKTDISEKKTTQHKKKNSKIGGTQADKIQQKNDLASVTEEQGISPDKNKEGSRGYNELTEQQNVKITYYKEPLW